MFGIFTPKFVKHAKNVLHGARKILRYRCDILKPAALEELTRVTEELAEAIKSGIRERIEQATEKTESTFGEHIPVQADAGWRENTEAIFVAVVIALGFRTFLLQPFTIPTGSMQPTLNGIIAYSSNEPTPNPVKRLFDLVWYGRTYFRVESKMDDVVLDLREVYRIPTGRGRGFFKATEIVCQNQRFVVPAQSRSVEMFEIMPGRRLKSGEVFINGYEEVGDHVLVDKWSYNFRAPHRGEVFVFTTRNISFIEKQLAIQGMEGSQFYIKRLAGLPGDELRIDATAHPGKLYVNGEVAKEPGFQRVMTGQNGYTGYTNEKRSNMLKLPDVPFRLPDHSYFALGDNSSNSQDGRYFGTVPEENLMGVACFVYWPFGRHWGFIR